MNGGALFIWECLSWRLSLLLGRSFPRFRPPLPLETEAAGMAHTAVAYQEIRRIPEGGLHAPVRYPSSSSAFRWQKQLLLVRV